MDAVELSETSFIVVNVLSQQFVNFIYAEVRVNFIQVPDINKTFQILWSLILYTTYFVRLLSLHRFLRCVSP